MHSRLRSKALGGALITALALAGCGSSSTSQSSTATTAAASATQTSSTPSATNASASTTTTSTATSEKVPNVDLQLTSPVKLEPLPAHYTCDGANVPPPISWGPVPPNTVEIELFLFNLLPVHGKLFASWAVAGLSPKVHGLSSGRLPAGAVVGRNSHGQIGYSLCPAKGPSVRYAFLLYALPHKLPVKQGFNAEALREKAVHVAEFAGLLATSYKRH